MLNESNEVPECEISQNQIKIRSESCSITLCLHIQARRTLLMRHEAEIKSNAYWLGLMAHLQATSVPTKVEFLNILLLTTFTKEDLLQSISMH